MPRFFLKFFRRRTLYRDLEAELQFHEEMSAARGNPIPLRRVSGIQEESADLWRFVFWEQLWRDVVYGIRGMRKNRPLVFGAAISLTLGIGANLALFSLAVEFLLSEPSVRDARSLVSVRLSGNQQLQPSAG